MVVGTSSACSVEDMMAKYSSNPAKFKDLISLIKVHKQKKRVIPPYELKPLHPSGTRLPVGNDDGMKPIHPELAGEMTMN